MPETPSSMRWCRVSSAVLDGVLPRARRRDPVTSVDAGRAADLTGSQAQALEFLRDGLALEWTLAEFVPAVRGWARAHGQRVYSDARYRSAVAELRGRGYIADTGRTASRGGSSHGLWHLVEVTA